MATIERAQAEANEGMRRKRTADRWRTAWGRAPAAPLCAAQKSRALSLSGNKLGIFFSYAAALSKAAHLRTCE